MSWLRDKEALGTYMETRTNPPDYPEPEPRVGTCKICGEEMAVASGEETEEDGICENCRKDIAHVLLTVTGEDGLEELEDFADKFLTALDAFDKMGLQKRRKVFTRSELHDILCEVFEW